jgi:hypothetical protein
MRRIGANTIIIGDRELSPGIVEIVEQRVVNFYELDDELPMTEWLGGTIEIIKNNQGILQAFKNNKLLC